MVNGLSRRGAIIRGSCLAASGFLLPDLATLAGFGKSADAAIRLPNASSSWRENLPLAAPPFHFMNSGGKILSLAHYLGTGLVVNFWATWCAPCRAELPTLVALNKRLHGSGIRVLLISIDTGGMKTVAPFYRQHNIKGLPILLDPSSSALDAFQTPGIPFTVIVNRGGDVVASLLGAGDWDTTATEVALHRLIGPPNRARRAKPTSSAPAPA